MARRKHAERAAAEAMKARRAHHMRLRSIRQRRQLLYAFGPILVVVAGLLGYAFYTFQYYRPRQPVARVSGQAITSSVFAQRLQYARRQVLNNVSQLTGMIQTDSSSFITDYANQQRTGVVQTTLDTLIDEVLIQKEAEARGITVSDQEVRDEICRQLQESTKITSPSDATATAAAAGDTSASDTTEGDTTAGDTAAVTDTAGAAIADSAGISGTDALTSTDGMTATDAVSATGDTTGTGASAAPTDVPKVKCDMSDAEFDRAFAELYLPVLTEATMTRATYDNLVRMNLYREALNKKLGEAVATTAPQVSVQYLVFDETSTAAAAAALEAAKAGTGWDALSTRYGPRAVNDETAGGATGALTETVSSGSASATFQSDPAGATGATTETGATGATTDTAKAAASPAPAPTATPNPYAVSKSDATTWYTKEKLKTALGFTDADVDKIFALAAGKPADALIKGSQGNYLVLLTAKDDKRALEGEELKSKKDAALEDWLKKTRTEKSAEINRFPLEVHTPPEPAWYIDGFDRILGTTSAAATLDINALMTQPPPAATVAP